MIAPDFPLEFAGFLYRNTHVPPHTPGRARPQPPSLTGPPSRPSPLGPLRPRGQALAAKFFQGSVPFFFRDIPDFTLASRNEGKIRYKRRKLTYCIEATLPAVPRRTERRAQASCWVAAFCMYTMWHKSLQLSQISMLTLTVTPSSKSLGFFRITSSWCPGAAASVQSRGGRSMTKCGCDRVGAVA